MGLQAYPRRTARPRHQGRRLYGVGDPRRAGIDPAPDRASSTLASFLRSQADALLACDFFETVTLTGAYLYVLAVIEHATRRIRVLGATAHPTVPWVVQAARNLFMDLEDAGCRARFLIRDRDGKYPALFDAVLKDTGLTVVVSGIQMPRMNAVTERCVLTCRRELLDRTLIWNQQHLLYALREFEHFYNGTGPTRESPMPGRCEHCLRPSPRQMSATASTSADGTASAASTTNTSTQHDLCG